MINQMEIEKSLKDIGIQKGMRVEVHSSLSSIGFVNGGAKTVIEALMRVITKNGSIIMPGFPLSRSIELTETDKSLGIASKKKFLPEDHSERTDMGLIADTFCKYPEVITGKGRHRFSAWGINDKKYCENLLNFINEDGYGLLIGVDIRSLSSMHYVENNMPEELWEKVFSPLNPKIKEIYNLDEWFITSGNNPPYFEGWLKVQEEAYQKGYIKTGKIGNSICKLFKVKQIIGIYENKLKSDPYELFGIEKV